jgi:hypothetical protein
VNNRQRLVLLNALLLGLTAISFSTVLPVFAQQNMRRTIMVGAWIAANGSIQYRYDGRRVDDKEFARLCDAERRKDVEFRLEEHPPLKGENALKAILAVARCTGATHIGFTGVDRYPEPKSAPDLHAAPPHKTAASH